ncbi:hypothetical protein B2904_orf2495 [Brachyspira pilosicoli B2904]|uniref:Lipocalin-like domain-containing protein n=1 Tax=Brachyspira pilosicoli B2904 TaxID=1133568 RepID=J9USK0_BRAPL|nr:hypothetical protein [Brachyspira pilosicoli]AFR71820.1 hypothetical protein B2904_orf2495 [Brachyspira pilosicoli B2904]
MSKKYLSLVLFLISALAVSCSNADKTGSGDNNSGIGDGGTTPQGIAKYEGTWQLTDAELTTILTISNNGAVTYYGETSTNVANNRNETYEVKFVDKDGPAGPGGILTLTLTFNNDTSGTFSNSDGSKGNITKQKNN